MPKLPILSSKDVIKALKHLGFEPAPKRGKGSHFAFVRKTKFLEAHYYQLLSNQA